MDHRPLAERLRPRDLAEMVGQRHVIDADRQLGAAIRDGRTGSLILAGPPGVGKTTLALLIAEASGLHFEPFSAVLSGVKEVRAAVAEARARRDAEGHGTLLFVDEIHRFNKAQQDAFLPHVESGDVMLIGATTENPSFSVIAPLLSRCRVVQLEPLDEEALDALLDRALNDVERGLGARQLRLAERARTALRTLAGGDGRRALGALEAAATTVADGVEIDEATVTEAFAHRALVHDRAGDHHYDLLSALHKSLRNSDVQAAVYWLARMIEAGADPLQAARRMVAVAAEDIGLADPMALQVAVSAFSAVERLGLPEGRLPLGEAVVYLAAAPKSNAVLNALDAATRDVRRGAQHPVPLHLRNAPTKLQREQGHGTGYRYAHDFPAGVAPMPCLPEALRDRVYFKPSGRGFEQRLAERMAEADRARGS
ncbi:MAG: replication-associated recombination protein A [Planctomycetota bacterium]